MAFFSAPLGKGSLTLTYHLRLTVFRYVLTSLKGFLYKSAHLSVFPPFCPSGFCKEQEKLIISTTKF